MYMYIGYRVWGIGYGVWGMGYGVWGDGDFGIEVACMHWSKCMLRRPGCIKARGCLLVHCIYTGPNITCYGGFTIASCVSVHDYNIRSRQFDFNCYQHP